MLHVNGVAFVCAGKRTSNCIDGPWYLFVNSALRLWIPAQSDCRREVRTNVVHGFREVRSGGTGLGCFTSLHQLSEHAVGFATLEV